MRAKLAAAVLAVIQLLGAAVDGAGTKRGGLCNVFDPFRVQPDSAKYQIGGPFPLHDSDCIWLRPDTVQEIVAIQWALTHWNQNPDNTGFKLGLHAGDTCSRPKEAISQTLRFLDTVGYYEPFECSALTPAADRPKLLGLIAPTDRLSAEALATFLNTARLPVAAYSTVAADALTDAGVTNVLSTAPSIDTYLQTFTSLMNHFESNLVTLVYSPEHIRSIDRVAEQLKNASIFIAETTSIKTEGLSDIIAKSDASIVLSLLDSAELASALALEGVQTLNKLWINVPANGYGLSADDQLTILSKGAHLQLISIQPRLKDLPQFREYFLGVLQSNYQSYSLLTSYVQQVFNCSLIGTPGFTSCEDLDRDHMASMFAQAPGVEAVVRTTYALAAIGSHLEKNRAARLACDRPNDECTKIIVNAMKSLKYNFGTYDPAEFTGDLLSFSSTSRGLLLANGVHIEAIHFFNDEKYGLIVNKIAEHSTGKEPRIIRESFRTKSTPYVKSKCPQYRPYCADCEHTVQVDSNKYFLSVPKQYQLYLLGLFDLHQGKSCQDPSNSSDISLPMALIHTIWTFRQRYPQLNLLNNVDLGALIVDSCSSGRHAIEVVSRSENDCLRLNTPASNVTIVPGSVFGFASGMETNQHIAMKSLFVDSEGESALIGVDANRNPLTNEFSAYPSTQSQAIAVLRFLNAMEWDFVTVVLSDRDADSVNAFGEFEAAAADYGICVAQVVKVHDGVAPSGDPITNATVVFATARDTAAYFAALHRARGVHVLVGDAHDWHIFETTDRRKFAGTVSIQPKDVLYGDFRQWLEIATPKTFPERWFWRYVEEHFKCALTPESTRKYGGKLCSGDELVDLSKLGRLTKSGYLARGIERFLFAMDAVYKRRCPQQKGVCDEFFTKGRYEIVEILKTTLIEDDFDIMNLRPGDDGKFDYYKIGNWSSETGLKFSEAYRSYDANGKPTQTIKSTCRPPLCKCNLDADFFTKPLQAAGPFVAREQNLRNFEPFEPEAESTLEQLASGEWRNQPWNYVFLVIITLLLIVAIAVLILVSVKMYLRVVKGNQSLGICLLLGVIMLYSTAYLFVFDASDILCRCRLFFHSLSYTICFGVMIAKATQLRNAETLGFATATHISYWNYWLLLFFIIAVQLALSVQWLVGRSSSTILIEGDRMTLMCSWGAYDFLWSQVYVVLLLLMALFVASLNRNIKRNYKETKWLFSAALLCVPIWMAWVVGYALVPLPFKNTVIVIELLACATVLLCFLFGPKLYILLSYEPVIIEYPPPTVAPSALHTTGKENPTAALRYDLFERDEDEPINRAVSPASSTGASTHSTALSQATSSSSSGAGSGDQSPMFKAVARRKSRSKRAKDGKDSVSRRYPMATVHGGVSARLA